MLRNWEGKAATLERKQLKKKKHSELDVIISNAAMKVLPHLLHQSLPQLPLV